MVRMRRYIPPAVHTPYQRYADAMDIPAGPSRPRSTWKVLGGLILAVAVGFLLLGVCVAAFVSSTPAHTLEVPRRDLDAGIPRFYPLTSFGADTTGRTFGAWVVLQEDGTANAFYSRDPRSSCYLPWRSDFVFEGTAGWFRDPCDGSTYTIEGSAVFGPAPRGIDQFDAEVSASTVTVDLERVRLGECRTVEPSAEQQSCSRPGQPRYEKKPPVVVPGGG